MEQEGKDLEMLISLSHLWCTDLILLRDRELDFVHFYSRVGLPVCAICVFVRESVSVYVCLPRGESPGSWCRFL